MREALAHYVILGVRTNLDHLQDVISHEAFRAGELTTAFLDEHFADWPGADAPGPGPEVLAAVALPVTRVGGTSAHAGGPGGGPGGEPFDPWRSGDGFRLGTDRGDDS